MLTPFFSRKRAKGGGKGFVTAQASLQLALADKVLYIIVEFVSLVLLKLKLPGESELFGDE